MPRIMDARSFISQALLGMPGPPQRVTKYTPRTDKSINACRCCLGLAAARAIANGLTELLCGGARGAIHSVLGYGSRIRNIGEL
jgi:hypothetical protein